MFRTKPGKAKKRGVFLAIGGIPVAMVLVVVVMVKVMSGGGDDVSGNPSVIGTPEDVAARQIQATVSGDGEAILDLMPEEFVSLMAQVEDKYTTRAGIIAYLDKWLQDGVKELEKYYGQGYTVTLGDQKMTAWSQEDIDNYNQTLGFVGLQMRIQDGADVETHVTFHGVDRQVPKDMTVSAILVDDTWYLDVLATEYFF